MINRRLLCADIQGFIRENLDRDPFEISLRGSKFEGVSSGEIAEQIMGRKKVMSKVAEWGEVEGLYFPQKLSLEQCSSAETGDEKSGMTYGRVVDGTGGLGVDSYYFSKKCKEVIHCEMQEELSEIAEHNFGVLGVENVKFYRGKFEDFLEGLEGKVDFIYLDPARRDKNKNKVVALEDCTPNVIDLMGVMFEKTDRVLLKISPMADIDKVILECKWVKEVRVVGVNNEVKELVVLIEKGFEGDVLTRAVNIEKGRRDEFSFYRKEGKEVIYSDIGAYFYEPNASIMKSGGVDAVCKKFGVSKVGRNSNYFTSEQEVEGFFGRVFRVVEVGKYDKGAKKRLMGMKANVSARNFYTGAEEIKKELKIKDGGDVYLFFTSDVRGEKVVVEAVKV